MGYQVTGFWIDYDYLREWWQTHELSRPWTGAEGDIAIGLDLYLMEKTGLKSKMAFLNRKVKCDYFDIVRRTRPGNKNSEREIFFYRRYRDTVGGKESYRDTDKAFADKLRQAGLTKFVFAMLEVYGVGRLAPRKDLVLYDSERDVDNDHSNSTGSL